MDQALAEDGAEAAGGRVADGLGEGQIIKRYYLINQLNLKIIY